MKRDRIATVLENLIVATITVIYAAAILTIFVAVIWTLNDGAPWAEPAPRSQPIVVRTADTVDLYMYDGDDNHAFDKAGNEIDTSGWPSAQLIEMRVIMNRPHVGVDTMYADSAERVTDGNGNVVNGLPWPDAQLVELRATMVKPHASRIRRP